MVQSLSAAISSSTLQLAELQNEDWPYYWSKEQQTVLHSAFPGVWHIQLRSLNHRFFELSCRLPDFAAHLELPLHKLLQRSLLRGRVECCLNYVSAADNGVADLLNARLRELQELRSTAEGMGFCLPLPNALELLRYCTEQQKAEPVPLSPAVEAALLGFCRAACCRLIGLRQREGRELHAELLELHRAVVRECESAHKWEGRIASHYRSRLQKKYRQFVENGESEHLDRRANEGFEERLLGELGWLLSRGDVREELSRLEIHAQQFRSVMDSAHDSKDPAQSCCAKELDFLLQEMNREANTLAAKSPLVELQQLAVRLKVLIEQMREQIKNVL